MCEFVNWFLALSIAAPAMHESSTAVRHLAVRSLADEASYFLHLRYQNVMIA
jgi:hypothetical protein